MESVGTNWNQLVITSWSQLESVETRWYKLEPVETILIKLQLFGNHSSQLEPDGTWNQFEIFVAEPVSTR